MNLFVDVFDGKYLIESISRTRFPHATYPFAVGDEIVAINGKTPADITASISKFISSGNPRARLRLAADYLFYRHRRNIRTHLDQARSSPHRCQSPSPASAVSKDFP